MPEEGFIRMRLISDAHRALDKREYLVKSGIIFVYSA